MRNPKVTIRYAKSLLTLSNELNKLEEVCSDMRFLRELCSESKDLLMLLKSPIIKVDLKLSILNKILNKNISDLSMSFIELVTKKEKRVSFARHSK
jgi:F-type H+-transporting ATPase subunit delta